MDDKIVLGGGANYHPSASSSSTSSSSTSSSSATSSSSPSPLLSSTSALGTSHLYGLPPSRVCFALEQVLLEWRKVEEERTAWAHHKHDLLTRIAALEDERAVLAKENRDLLKRVAMLEYGVQHERARSALLMMQEPGWYKIDRPLHVHDAPEVGALVRDSDVRAELSSTSATAAARTASTAPSHRPATSSSSSSSPRPPPTAPPTSSSTSCEEKQDSSTSSSQHPSTTTTTTSRPPKRPSSAVTFSSTKGNQYFTLPSRFAYPAHHDPSLHGDMWKEYMRHDGRSLDIDIRAHQRAAREHDAAAAAAGHKANSSSNTSAAGTHTGSHLHSSLRSSGGARHSSGGSGSGGSGSGSGAAAGTGMSVGAARTATGTPPSKLGEASTNASSSSASTSSPFLLNKRKSLKQPTLLPDALASPPMDTSSSSSSSSSSYSSSSSSDASSKSPLLSTTLVSPPARAKPTASPTPSPSTSVSTPAAAAATAAVSATASSEQQPSPSSSSSSSGGPRTSAPTASSLKPKLALRHHLDSVRFVAFDSSLSSSSASSSSSDGSEAFQFVVGSASDDGTAKLWSVGPFLSYYAKLLRTLSIEPVHTFRAHRDVVTSLALLASRKTVATASIDGTVCVWDMPRLDDDVYACVGCHDPGRRATLRHADAVWSLTFGGGGVPGCNVASSTLLFAAVADGTVAVWDAASSSGVLTTPAASISLGANGMIGTSIALWRQDTTKLLCGTTSGALSLIDIERSTVVSSMEDTQPGANDLSKRITQIASHPHNGSVLTAHVDHALRAFDPRQGSSVLYNIPAHADCVSTVSVSHDGAICATGSHDQTIRLWDIAGGSRKCVQILDAHQAHRSKGDEAVLCVALHPSLPMMVSGGADAIVKVYQ